MRFLLCKSLEESNLKEFHSTICSCHRFILKSHRCYGSNDENAFFPNKYHYHPHQKRLSDHGKGRRQTRRGFVPLPTIRYLHVRNCNEASLYKNVTKIFIRIFFHLFIFQSCVALDIHLKRMKGEQNNHTYSIIMYVQFYRNNKNVITDQK